MGLQDIKFNVHAHPTLSEVLDELFKAAHVETKAPGKVCPPFHFCLTYTSCSVFTSAAALPFRDQGPSFLGALLQLQYTRTHNGD